MSNPIDKNTRWLGGLIVFLFGAWQYWFTSSATVLGLIFMSAGLLGMLVARLSSWMRSPSFAPPWRPRETGDVRDAVPGQQVTLKDGTVWEWDGAEMVEVTVPNKS